MKTCFFSPKIQCFVRLCLLIRSLAKVSLELTIGQLGGCLLTLCGEAEPLKALAQSICHHFLDFNWGK